MAVSRARELMRLCEFGDDAITATELRVTVDRAMQADAKGGKPEWVRLPTHNGKCPYSSLSRSALYILISPSRENRYNPPVRSICLRRKDTAWDVRLVHVQSLLDFLEAQQPWRPAAHGRKRFSGPNARVKALRRRQHSPALIGRLRRRLPPTEPRSRSL